MVVYLSRAEGCWRNVILEYSAAQFLRMVAAELGSLLWIWILILLLFVRDAVKKISMDMVRTLSKWLLP